MNCKLNAFYTLVSARLMPIISPRICCLALILTATWPAAVAAKPSETRILLLGSYHMHNPGLDAVNIDADDVLAPTRQRELKALANALMAFKPTKVAVETKPKDDSLLMREPVNQAALKQDRNEITQIGERVALLAGIKHLHAVDAEGSFDMQPLQALSNARARHYLQLMNEAATDLGQQMNENMKQMSIPAYLAWLNSEDMINANHAFYALLLQVSDGTKQPGAKLVADWYWRNAMICDRILQIAEPGDRILVLYGVGHVYWLRHCLNEIDNVVVESPASYLTNATTNL